MFMSQLGEYWKIFKGNIRKTWEKVVENVNEKWRKFEGKLQKVWEILKRNNKERQGKFGVNSE